MATESGWQALARGAGRVSGGQLVLTGVSGRLAGPLRIESLVFASADLRVEVRQLELDWAPGALLAGRLHLHRLQAQGLAWSAAPSPEPATPPATLTLPLAVAVDQFAVGRLEWAAWPGASPAPPPVFTLRDWAGGLLSDGRHHQFQGWTAQGDFGALALDGRLDGQPPFALEARLGLAGARDGRAYALEGQAAGTLLAPDLAITGSGAGLRGEGRILAAPFAALPVKEISLHLADLDPALFDPAWPAASLNLDATLSAVPADAAAQSLALAGPVTLTNQTPRPVDQGGLPVERLAGRLRWSAAAWLVQALDGRLPGGGRIGGEGRWAPGPTGAGQGEARLAVEAVDLKRLDTRLPTTRLAGALAGRSGADGQAVDARLADARFRLDLSAHRAGHGVAVNALTLQAGPGVLQGTGRVDLGGEGAFAFTGQLRHFDPRAFLASAPAADLNLDLTSRGHIFGDPEGRLDFKLAPSRLAGQPLAGEGAVALTADQHLAVPRLWLTLAASRLEAAGALGRPGEALSLRVEAPQLDALGGGYGGRLNLDGRVTGSLAAPSARFSGAIQYLVVPGVARVGGANFLGEVAPGQDGGVSLILGASRLGRPGVQGDWLDALTVQLAGTRGAHEWVVQAASGARDRWRVALEGGLAAGGWQGRLREVSGEGPQAPRLEAPASLVLGPAGGSLGAATVHIGEGVVHLAETRWSPAATVLRGDLRGLGFGLLATDGGPVRRGQATLRLGAEWDLRLTDRVEGQARLYRESGDLVLLGDVPARLGLETFEAVLSAQSSRLAASVQARGSQLGAFSATATALAEKGADGWRLAPKGALLGAARLTMPSIAWLGPLTHPGLVSEGRLEAAFSLSGTPAHPLATGTVAGGQLGFSLADLGLRLTGGTLAAAFDQDELRLTNLEFLTPNGVRPKDARVAGVATLGGEPGRLAVQGSVALATGEGRFTFTAARLPILQNPDRWLMVSGEGTARTGWDQLDLNARLQADAGFIGLADSPAPSLSDDVVILGRGEGARLTPFRFSLDATVDLGPRLYLSALGVDARLEGSLRLRSQDGRAVAASGTVSTAGGVYAGYGQKLAIERGRVSFSGPLDNPGLNVVALRKGLAVEAGVSITGTARRPRVQLVSEPTVPDAEKLSWIVLGRAPDSAGGGDMGLLIPAAQALLGGPGGGMTAQLAGSLGLDQLSVGQGDLNSVSRGATSRVVGTGSAITAGSTVSGQVLSLGKRLSDEAFVTFEQSLGGAESIVKLTYQLSRRLSLIARGGTDNAVDLSYSFSFR